MLTQTDDIRATDTDEGNIGGVASVVTLNFGTGIVGNCGCPCIED
jgi:hypothetical protein